GLLADARLVKLVLYVNDLAASRAFYENVLDLELLESDEASATYDTGQVLLSLEPASDHGITLAPRDRSADLTFLVDDLDATRDALGDRGLQFTKTLRYEIGATADFYDPDGHWMSLYE